MVTGVLIGWKGNDPHIIEAGKNLGSMTAKFKKLNLELASGKGEYGKVEFFKSAFKKAVARKKSDAEEIFESGEEKPDAKSSKKTKAKEGII